MLSWKRAYEGFISGISIPNKERKYDYKRVKYGCKYKSCIFSKREIV